MERRRLRNERRVEEFLYECGRRFLDCRDWPILWVTIDGKFEIYGETSLGLPAKNIDFLPKKAEVVLHINVGDYFDAFVEEYAGQTYSDFKNKHLKRYEAILAQGQWSRDKSQKFLLNDKRNVLAVNYDGYCVCFPVEESLITSLKMRLDAEMLTTLPQNVSYIRHNV
tara:strand:+ start:16 stop:519 length:504 start_codon:yes stop_codon:yes gene_type:complete